MAQKPDIKALSASFWGKPADSNQSNDTRHVQPPSPSKATTKPTAKSIPSQSDPPGNGQTKSPSNRKSPKSNDQQKKGQKLIAKSSKPAAVDDAHSESKEDPEDLIDGVNKRKIPKDVRIAVIGNVDSGKSTMIGVLTSGEFDDGRGLARSRILRHNHEQSNGRTSCSSQHILGFSAKKKPIHQKVSISATPKQKTAGWSSVFLSSTSLVTFIDLAGHEKYLKTTISGLTGCFPDYAFIVVGANMGISKMTREHIQVAVALSIPLFVVLTKIDISPQNILKHSVKTLVKLLRSPVCNNKMPMIIRKKKEIKLLFEKDPFLERICPIFCVSAVKGDNIDKLNYFLSQLQPRTPWKHRIDEFSTKNGVQSIKEDEEQKSSKEDVDESLSAKIKKIENAESKTDGDAVGGDGVSEGEVVRDRGTFGELEIDETFAVRGVGIVVSGTVTAGRIFANQRLFLGPFTDCSFKEILVRSVQMKRVQVDDAVAGETCSVALRFVKRKEVVDRVMIRKGMVAVSEHQSKPKPVWGFTATILVLHHPTTINEGYQPVVHCGNIRQTATIMKMSKHRLRSGDSALIDLKFLLHPEYLHSGRAVIIREGSTKCIGKVIALYPEYDCSLSDFKELERAHLNIQRFDDSFSKNGYKGSTLIFDETKKIVTKEELRKLEDEMKELKLQKKKEKELRKKKEAEHQKEADSGNAADQ